MALAYIAPTHSALTYIAQIQIVGLGRLVSWAVAVSLARYFGLCLGADLRC